MSAMGREQPALDLPSVKCRAAADDSSEPKGPICFVAEKVGYQAISAITSRPS